jgi:chorismate-pyruvate lyase
MTKPLLEYPNHPEFEELLNSCGSMTKQLEALGRHLSVTLLYEGVIENCFHRYITLNLNQIPVVLACSNALIEHDFFAKLLQNANTTPIGKFLFASGSTVARDSSMELDLIHSTIINDPRLQDYFQQHKYQLEQLFWQRKSIFRCQNQQLSLIEIILPELEEFFQSL